MGRAKVAITIDESTLAALDELVSSHTYPNRSQAVEAAVQEKLERLNRTRLARECAKLVSDDEQALAEEGIGRDIEEWPEY